MRRQLNARRVLLLAIALGLLTVVLLQRYLASVKAQATAVPMGNEVVAVRDIPANTVLTADMLAVQGVPAQYIVPGAATDPKKVVGAVAKVDLFKGEPLLNGRLFRGETNAGLPYLIPAGKRAVTVAVDKLDGFAGMLKAGYYVDLLAVLPAGFAGQKDPEVTTLVQNVQLLATGDVTDTGGARQPAAAARNASAPYDTVTLLVTPLAAEEVAYVAKLAGLRLALRPATDHNQGPVPPLTTQRLLELSQ